MKRCIALMILSFVLGFYLQKFYPHEAERTTKEGKKILYWRAPMDPNYHSDKPGKSPMGMDLVPVYEEESNPSATIRISPVVEHNLGVRTIKVKRKDIARTVDTVGFVTSDENQVDYIHVYTSGWIKELAEKAEGDFVEKGELLFKMYSPKIVNAQEEYILAVKNHQRTLIDPAIEKLFSLGFSKKQMERLKTTQQAEELTEVYAGQSGIISEFSIGEGMFVGPEKTLLAIEDLTKIWVIAEVYERQSEWVKIGQKVQMTLPYLPNRVWEGSVNYIYPELDPKSHTLQVRMEFSNPTEELKLNMYGDVKIYADPRKNVLVVPQEAVIYNNNETRVVKQVMPGMYHSQQVELGIESEEEIEVLYGLEEGDSIVTSAQFLIDSESNLHAGLQRMDGSKELPSSHKEHKER